MNTQKLSRLCYYLNRTVTEGITLTLVYVFDMLTFAIKNSKNVSRAKADGNVISFAI